MSKGKIRIGVTGWNHGDWRGAFYPEGLPNERHLAFAAEELRSIEIASTYHDLQSQERFAAWASAVPRNFLFSVKGARFLTNRNSLLDAGRGLDKFFGQGLSELKGKLGPIMWQFAPRKKFAYSELRRFLEMLPETIEGRRLRHAIDARDPSFLDPSFAELCRSKDIAIVYSEHPDYQRIDEAGTSFRYARIMRASRSEPLGLPEAELDRLAKTVRGWAESGADVFLYFAGGDKVRNPAAARALIKRLDA